MVMVLCLLSGMADGLAEVLKFHGTAFSRHCPNANMQYWLPEFSWRNKYKNGDPSCGERYWQSSRALVWLTDGYHMSRMLRNVSILAAIVIPVSFCEWWQYVAAFVSAYLCYTAGFWVVYEKLLKAG